MPSEIYNNHFDSALIIYNPNSPLSIERSSEASKILLPLVQNIEVKASESGNDENFAIINNQNRGQNNLIVAVGGDGLVNDVASAMIKSQLNLISKSTIVPLRSGHANDISRSLFNKRNRDDIAKIVQTGTIENIHPLVARINAPNSMHTFSKIALGYFSIGSSSEIANLINQPAYRELRNSKTRLWQHIDDVRLTNKIVGNKQEYRVSNDDESLIVTDYWIINGSWIGGVIPIQGITITGNEAGRIVTKPREFYINAGKAAIGDIELVDSNFNDSVKIESFHPIHIQYDGNTNEIASGSTINFSISKTPIQTISTRKPKKSAS